MQPQTAVVIGGTGFIGELLLNELLCDKQFESVRALVRRHAGAPHPKLEAQIVDFNNLEEFKQKLGSADCLFCCVGTTRKKVKGNKAAYRKVDFDIPLHAAQFAKAAGFKSFLMVTAVGANAKSGNFYLRLKGEVENAVEAAGVVSLHIFQPSMLMGARDEFRLGEKIGKALMKIASFMLQGSLRKYRGIEGSTVAKAMVKAAKIGGEGKHVYLYDDMIKLAK